MYIRMFGSDLPGDCLNVIDLQIGVAIIWSVGLWNRTQTFASPHDGTMDQPPQDVDRLILTIRGERVLIDADLARLYGVSTRRLNEQVKRNHSRFPDDFAFRLTAAEKRKVVANCDHLSALKYSSSLPRVFTEHGAIMAANVPSSDRAVEMSVFIVRAFVRLRKAIQLADDIRLAVSELERRVGEHDDEIELLVRTLRKLISPSPAE